MGEPLENGGRFEFDGAEGIAFWVGNSDEETAVKVMFSELENLAKFLRFNFPGLFDGTEDCTCAWSSEYRGGGCFEDVAELEPTCPKRGGDAADVDSDVVERAARAYDPEAFEDHPIEQKRPLAAIQWGARRLMATEAAQRLAAAGLLTPADGLRPDSDVIERAARLLHALQWMGDQEDADAAWDRYPITSATRSDYLRTAEALAAAGLLTPSDTFASTKSGEEATQRLARAAFMVDGTHHFWVDELGRPVCLCGFIGNARKRTQTEHITSAVLEAFDHD